MLQVPSSSCRSIKSPGFLLPTPGRFKVNDPVAVFVRYEVLEITYPLELTCVNEGIVASAVTSS